MMALMLAVVLAAGPEICPPDPDPEGLLAAMSIAAAQLELRNAEAVADAITVIRSYARERKALCALVAVTRAQLADQQALRERWKEIATLEGQDAKQWKQEWEKAMKASTTAQQERWYDRLGCFVGPSVTIGLDSESVAGVGLGCGVSLW